jgi:predicted kinase
MNILFIAPYAPNPVRVRPYEFVRALLRRGHTVTLAALWTSDAERADLAHLAAQGATVLSEPDADVALAAQQRGHVAAQHAAASGL